MQSRQMLQYMRDGYQLRGIRKTYKIKTVRNCILIIHLRGNDRIKLDDDYFRQFMKFLLYIHCLATKIISPKTYNY